MNDSLAWEQGDAAVPLGTCLLRGDVERGDLLVGDADAGIVGPLDWLEGQA